MTVTEGAVTPPNAGEEDATDNKRITALIVNHLESYLSPENLKKDAKLAKAAVNGKITVNALSRIEYIRKLTTNRDRLLEALLESDKFALDRTYSWVTIKKKQRERNVLILREIDSNTPVEEIKEIFAGFTDLPQIKNIRSDVGDNWFITFNNQDDCMAAALKLSTEGKFKGNSLKVRVKAILAQAEQKSGFTTQASPVRGPLMNTYSTSPYSAGPVYPASPMRGRGLGGRGMASPRRRGGMLYPNPMVIGSPRQHMMSASNHHAASSDYPGNFRLFTPENMRELIRTRYESEIADKPVSLNSDEVRDIVTNRPKSMGTMHSRPTVLDVAPGGGTQQVGGEEPRKKDRQRRKKSNAARKSGENTGRPAGGTAQGSKPRQKSAKRRGSGRGRKEPMK